MANQPGCETAEGPVSSVHAELHVRLAMVIGYSETGTANCGRRRYVIAEQSL